MNFTKYLRMAMSLPEKARAVFLQLVSEGFQPEFAFQTAEELVEEAQ